MTQENKKYPLTVFGLYTTSGANSRSAIITQENADKACAAIQAAVGGKLAVKATSEKTRAAKMADAEARNVKYTFPDYFLEAVTPDLLAEERARMAEQGNKPYRATAGGTVTLPSFSQGDDAL